MTRADAWDPRQYERFERERAQPFHDLLALVAPEAAMRVVDLGCGTGALTRHMHEKLGAKETLGVDSSEAMLARAAEQAASGLRFERGDLATFAGRDFDLVVSNAAIHWVDDHDALLARLTAMLAPRGQLAVQLPANFDHPSHTLAVEIAREPPFAEALGGWQRHVPVLAPEAYATLLHRLGYVEQTVRLQVYGHVLSSSDDVVEWVKGTLLTDYAKRLPDALYTQFVERFRERLVAALGDARPYFYPFKRILFRARRA